MKRRDLLQSAALLAAVPGLARADAPFPIKMVKILLPPRTQE